MECLASQHPAGHPAVVTAWAIVPVNDPYASSKERVGMLEDLLGTDGKDGTLFSSQNVPDRSFA